MRRSCSPQQGREPVENVALRLQFLIPVFVSCPNSKFREDRDTAADFCTLGESNGTYLKEIFYAEPHAYAERHTCKDAFPGQFSDLGPRRHRLGNNGRRTWQVGDVVVCYASSATNFHRPRFASVHTLIPLTGGPFESKIPWLRLQGLLRRGVGSPDCGHNRLTRRLLSTSGSPFLIPGFLFRVQGKFPGENAP